MEPSLTPFALATVLGAVALMGFAIQRGGTCTVAAVEEILRQRSTRRLRAMGEAALWVAGGLALAQALGWTRAMPAPQPPGLHTVLGAVLLGLGAWINGACVFGAIARLGSGQWAQAAVPAGFFLGCLGIQVLGAAPAVQPSAQSGGLPQAPLAAAFVLFAAWRLVRGLRGGGGRSLAARVWAPHAATAVIGLTFLLSWLMAGAWAYTDLLAALARRMAAQPALPLALLAALLGGALLGGWTAGRLRSEWPTPAQWARSLVGGALMAAGSLLIPGSNDALVLVGLPLFHPHAWLAFTVMCLSIAAAMRLAAGLRAPAARRGWQ
ncbi:YeeE/YedE thiosulfate transporter family protein [Azohydromonas caseinilytica]|uniref:YeeE/YedE family protein n=1 Tax=Azohydromonas caseinilytica TaxID=2728836 RepID=A0A848F9L6_9BURK|nr:YeeE/YedE thiosulfate transporter family protein [Azohydromonas caseinilytica]NML15425.1 YeeE/YedE family protein [Azohydromonas caseinilytica]